MAHVVLVYETSPLTLPDGRTTVTTRWRHLDPTARRRCRRPFTPVP